MKRSGLNGSWTLFLFSFLIAVSGQAPGDEHSFCQSLNENYPPNGREPNRKILLDSYNYAGLLFAFGVPNTNISDVSPVFQQYNLAGTLMWNQARSRGNCRVDILDCKISAEQTVSPESENDWVVTQLVRVAKVVRELRVFLNFTVTKCPTGITAPCRDTFTMYIIPANDETVIDMAAVQAYASSVPNNARKQITGPDEQVTSEYFKVDQQALLTGYDGFHIALQSRDTCVTIHRVQVLYWECAAGRQGLVYVNAAGEPQQTSTFQCVGNSTLHLQATQQIICTVTAANNEETADWTIVGDPTPLSEACGCDPGFGFSQENGEDVCTECPPSTFKEGVASVACSPCPANSSAVTSGAASCQCDEGFYRGTTESASLPCAVPPGAPQNLTASDAGSETVRLSWRRPNITGTRTHLFYTISFRAEGSAEWTRGAVVNDSSSVVNYTLSGLLPFTTFDIRVTADSSATDTVPENMIDERSQVVTITTEQGKPGQGSPPELEVPLYSTSIVVKLVEQDMANGEVLQYTIRWYLVEEGANRSSVATVSGSATSYTIDGLAPGRYAVQVQVMNSLGLGTFSEPREIEVEGVPAWLIIAVIAAVVGAATLVAIFIVVVCVVRMCIRKRKERAPRRFSSDTENAALVSFGKNGFNLPEKKKKIYVDPRNYATTDDALKDFAKEIPPHEIRLEKVIGGGEFGDVCQGWWHKPNQKKPSKIAVKTLKSGSPNKAREDFLTEATIMGQFEDPNVISLFGVVSKSEPVMIVMEFMSHGSLEHYLKKNDGLLNNHRLVKMASGVASGMKYLAGIGFVHRDLAARNILVGEGETCKISDFGLSRETEENVYNVKTGGKIPVRWTPPEAIHYRKFSEKSDVWSFGVLLWEVMSYGSQPYADWGNQQVLREVDKGYRLPCPQDCPDCIYYVMMKCWDKDDKSRPKFAEIKEELEDLYKNDFVGRSKPPRRREPIKGPLEYTSIKEWLEGLKMEQYIDNFTGAGLSLKECCDLSQDDLATIGIMVLGHQHKIMTSVNIHNKRNSVANGSAE